MTGNHPRCSDHFVRFWFRFVRPYQAELEAGADLAAYWAAKIDAVGILRRKVVVVAEAKWTIGAMSAVVLTDIRDYKVPALG